MFSSDPNSTTDNTARENNEMKGKKARPEVLSKYQSIKLVYEERPSEFTLKDLCKKHSVPYGNFMSWYRNQRLKASPEKRFVSPPPPIVPTGSIVVAKLEDLITSITLELRDAIKGAIIQGVKDGKIKIIG